LSGKRFSGRVSLRKMQAEGGFGSRRIYVGCFASVIEFGPQCLTDIHYNSACISIIWVPFAKKRNYCREFSANNSPVIEIKPRSDKLGLWNEIPARILRRWNLL